MTNIKIIKEAKSIFSYLLEDVSKNQAKITKDSMPTEHIHPTKKKIFFGLIIFVVLLGFRCEYNSLKTKESITMIMIVDIIHTRLSIFYSF